MLKQVKIKIEKQNHQHYLFYTNICRTKRLLSLLIHTPYDIGFAHSYTLHRGHMDGLLFKHSNGIIRQLQGLQLQELFQRSSLIVLINYYCGFLPMHAY